MEASIPTPVSLNAAREKTGDDQESDKTLLGHPQKDSSFRYQSWKGPRGALGVLPEL